jgi:hypothetical protein
VPRQSSPITPNPSREPESGVNDVEGMPHYVQGCRVGGVIRVLAARWHDPDANALDVDPQGAADARAQCVGHVAESGRPGSAGYSDGQPPLLNAGGYDGFCQLGR